MRGFILLGLGLITCYDVFTTIMGTMQILGNDIGAILASIILGTVIGGLLYFSYEVHSIDSDAIFPNLLKVLWALALIYDLWTSFTGNNRFIIKTGIELNDIDYRKLLILIGLTLFVSSCPIILSYLRNNLSFMTDRSYR